MELEPAYFLFCYIHNYIHTLSILQLYLPILFWNIENLTHKSSKMTLILMVFYYDFLSIKVQKRNGIAQRKWTKINVQFSKVLGKVRNDHP
jgi:hypothetical protein